MTEQEHNELSLKITQEILDVLAANLNDAKIEDVDKHKTASFCLATTIAWAMYSAVNEKGAIETLEIIYDTAKRCITELYNCSNEELEERNKQQARGDFRSVNWSIN